MPCELGDPGKWDEGGALAACGTGGVFARSMPCELGEAGK